MSNIELTFENPWLLLLLIPAFAVILLPFFFLPKTRRKNFRKVAPVVIHIIVVALLILIIAGFTITENSDSQAVLLLVDLSDSTQSVQAQIEDHAKQLTELIDRETPVGVLVFGAERMYTVKFEDPRGFVVDTVDAAATDIAAALEYGATLLPQDKAGHIILLTDGKETDGDALSAAQFLSSRDIRIDAVWFDTTMQNAAEVQLGSFIAPEGAYIGDTLAFTADVESNTEARIILKLYDNDGEVLSQEQAIVPGSNVFELTAVAETSGNHAYKLIENQLQMTRQGQEKRMGGGTYPNLFDSHPPFQLDGNFGCTAGIAEMLMQSHDGDVWLLPALPDYWQEGEIKGLVARGGFVIDMKWSKGRVTKLTVTSRIGGNLRLRSANRLSAQGLKTAKGENPNPLFTISQMVVDPIISPEAKLNPVAMPKTYLYDLKTEAGKSYVIVGK